MTKNVSLKESFGASIGSCHCIEAKKHGHFTYSTPKIASVVPWADDNWPRRHRQTLLKRDVSLVIFALNSQPLFNTYTWKEISHQWGFLGSCSSIYSLSIQTFLEFSLACNCVCVCVCVCLSLCMWLHVCPFAFECTCKCVQTRARTCLYARALWMHLSVALCLIVSEYHHIQNHVAMSIIIRVTHCTKRAGHRWWRFWSHIYICSTLFFTVFDCVI